MLKQMVKYLKVKNRCEGQKEKEEQNLKKKQQKKNCTYIVLCIVVRNLPVLSTNHKQEKLGLMNNYRGLSVTTYYQQYINKQTHNDTPCVEINQVKQL